jgi:hypothetical protein
LPEPALQVDAFVIYDDLIRSIKKSWKHGERAQTEEGD